MAVCWCTAKDKDGNIIHTCGQAVSAAGLTPQWWHVWCLSRQVEAGALHRWQAVAALRRTWSLTEAEALDVLGRWRELTAAAVGEVAR